MNSQFNYVYGPNVIPNENNPSNSFGSYMPQPVFYPQEFSTSAWDSEIEQHPSPQQLFQLVPVCISPCYSPPPAGALYAMQPAPALLSPQTVNVTPAGGSHVPMFVYPSPQRQVFNQHPLQRPEVFAQTPKAAAGAPVQDSNDMAASDYGSPSPPNKLRTPPPGFQKMRCASTPSSSSPTAETRPNTFNRQRSRNAKRKSKKQVESVTDPSDYRPSYRSKQDMIDYVYSKLSQKYTELGVLETNGLRGDDTIRVHVKNFKALSRIEQALVAVESNPHVKISKVSLPFSFRNEFQKKGFLVYLKLESVTMVPYAQSVFRQYEEFKKCGVMRETGQYVESLPLTQVIDTKCTAEQKHARRESTPDYESSNESASSETEVGVESDSEGTYMQNKIESRNGL